MLGYYKEAIDGKIFSFFWYLCASYHFIKKIEESQWAICSIIYKKAIDH